jgi:hypothetical protein
VSVTLSSQPGATIRYTLDGTDPTTTSPLYSGPLNIASAATLKAKAFHPDYPTSAIASATYTFAAAAPTFSPPAGTYTTAQTVTLATPTSGATIRYTTDGSTPTTSSAQYTGPIAVNTQTTLSAKTFKSGYADSAAASAVYTLNYGTLPAPTMSPGTNTYSNDVSVTLSSSQTGATIRYTLDGSDPTASSPLYGGPLTITSSTTVKAKAFHPDYTMSPTASETYTLVAATPTLSPAAGTYTSAQNVTMTTATNGATIRYTTDGSTPTAASTQYTGPIAINTQTTVSAKAFRTGYTDSAAANALYAFNYGTLATPTAAPAPGLFTPPVTVTLSGPAGATIRYTTDGSDPVDTSPVYTTALTLSQTTTLKARAFQVDWIPSAVLTAVYTIQSDITPPTIVAIVNPGPNAAGWNQTPVTVSFICKDDTEVASCPAPVAITTETDGQVVTGQVTDTVGNTATASVTVRIDMTPPTVTLMTPTMDFSTTDTQVQVLASASDSRSGVRDAMCSLASSSITGGTIGCSVPLGKGQNPVIVQVTDVAGNSASAAVQVTRTGTPSSLIISPATLTLLVDDELSLQVQDDFGNTPSGAVTWTVSDPAIAEVITDTETRIHALALGTATVTATAGGLTASATLTVSAGTVLAAGTMRWSVPPVPGADWDRFIFAHAVPETGVDLFLLEYNSDGSGQILRGMDLEGRDTSRQALRLPYMSRDPFGDVYGGVVFNGRTQDTNPRRDVIVRVGGGSGTAWTYAADVDYRFMSKPAQTYGGVISILEWNVVGENGQGWFMMPAFLVRLEGSTGSVLSRVELPMVVTHYDNGYVEEIARFVGDPVVGTDGATSQLLVSGEGTKRYRSDATYTSLNLTLQVLRIAPDGTSSLRALATSTDLSGYTPNAWPESLVADPTGRLIGYTSNASAIWVITDQGYTEYSLPGGDDLTITYNSIALRGGDALRAVDLNTGAELLNYPQYSTVVAPVTGGGAIAQTADGVVQIDSAGVASPLTELAALDAPVPRTPGLWIGRLSSGTDAGSLASVVSASTAGVFFQAEQGHREGHLAPPDMPTCSDGETGDRTQTVRNYVTNEVTVKVKNDKNKLVDVPYHPSCEELTQTLPSLSHYAIGTAGEANTWDTSNRWNVLLLKESVVANLYCIVSDHGADPVPTMNSGYRSPEDQLRIQGRPVNDWNNARHVLGDAADLDTPSGTAGDPIWSALRYIAKDGSCGSACVEPRKISPAHFHVDYRPTCPAQW